MSWKHDQYMMIRETQEIQEIHHHGMQALELPICIDSRALVREKY
jgi:hypothetical protein